MKQALAVLGVIDPKHGADYHLEGNPLHGWTGGQDHPVLPVLQLALSCLPSDFFEALDSGAMKCGAKQATLSEVALTAKQEKRMGTSHHFKLGVDDAGVAVFSVEGEKLLDRGWIREVDDLPHQGRVHREGLAIAALTPAEERERPAEEHKGLHECGERRAGRYLVLVHGMNLYRCIDSWASRLPS
ncbi:MAG TPA: hypothetical protein VGO36_02655 [Solirubrobacterales bacterium]|nr:hypothetical protein [Solirubrobacterales bacterium]